MKKQLKSLESRPRTRGIARALAKKCGINIDELNEIYSHEETKTGINLYFYTKRSDEDFKKYIISNRDYAYEIKMNKARLGIIDRVKEDEIVRTCTKCKKLFITKVDKKGIPYNTRCIQCKHTETFITNNQRGIFDCSRDFFEL